MAETPLAVSYSRSEGHAEKQRQQQKGRPKDRPEVEEKNVGNRFDFSRVSPPWLSPQGHTRLLMLDPLPEERVLL